MTVDIRPLEEADVEAAEHVCRLAFGTFFGLPEPVSFRGDGALVRPRFLADPSGALIAETEDGIVGSGLITNWGSVGLFGPLTVHPDRWSSGIGRSLTGALLDLLDARGHDFAGLWQVTQYRSRTSRWTSAGVSAAARDSTRGCRSPAAASGNDAGGTAASATATVVSNEHRVRTGITIGQHRIRIRRLRDAGQGRPGARGPVPQRARPPATPSAGSTSCSPALRAPPRGRRQCTRWRARGKGPAALGTVTDMTLPTTIRDAAGLYGSCARHVARQFPSPSSTAPDTRPGPETRRTERGRRPPQARATRVRSEPRERPPVRAAAEGERVEATAGGGAARISGGGPPAAAARLRRTRIHGTVRLQTRSPGRPTIRWRCAPFSTGSSARPPPCVPRKRRRWR